MKKKILQLALVVFVVLLMATSAGSGSGTEPAAYTMFLKVDGIPGESTDEMHPNWIEVLSFDMGVTQSASASASFGGGASSERADFQDFAIVKLLDKASPKLAIACADGTHISEVQLVLCRTGGDKLKFMEYKLSNCIVSSVSASGSVMTQGSATLPFEMVTFNYGKIEWTYTQQRRADGSGGGNVGACWDLEKNAKC